MCDKNQACVTPRKVGSNCHWPSIHVLHLQWPTVRDVQKTTKAKDFSLTSDSKTCCGRKLTMRHRNVVKDMFASTSSRQGRCILQRLKGFQSISGLLSNQLVKLKSPVAHLLNGVPSWTKNDSKLCVMYFYTHFIRLNMHVFLYWGVCFIQAARRDVGGSLMWRENADNYYLTISSHISA